MDEKKEAEAQWKALIERETASWQRLLRVMIVVCVLGVAGGLWLIVSIIQIAAS